VSRNGLRLSDAERSARAETLVRRATDATDAYFARRAARLNREAITALKARPPLSYPYLTDTSGEGAALLTRIHAAVPRGVPESVRADACQAIVLAVLSGEISEEQVEAVAHEYVRRQYPPKRFLSLDAQLRGRYSLLEQLTSDDTLGAWVARGPYGDALADCVGVGDLAERLSDAWEANRLKGERVMTYSGFSPMRHCDSEAMVAGRKGMYIGVRRYKYVPSSAGQRARDMLAWDVEGYRARRLAEESSP
jgi:hypothetical protein